MAITYSTKELEIVKLIEQKISVEGYTNPSMLEGFTRKSYVGKDSVNITDIKLNDREFIAKITTNIRDRDNEIVSTEGIDLRQYNKNMVILWAHDYIQPAIGRARWIKRFTDPVTRETALIAKGLMAKGTPRAEEVLTLMQQEILNTISIGFIPIAGHEPTDEEIKADANLKGVRWIHDKVVLLEFSIVNVPANPNATIEAVSKGTIEMSVDMQKELSLYSPPNTPIPDVSKKAIPYFQTPVDGVNAGWSLSEETREANVEQLAIMAAWIDNDDKESPKSYKLIHHRKIASHPLVWDGLVEAMSKLQLFTAKIPNDNRRGVYNHLAKHYRDDFGKEPPEFIVEPKQFDSVVFEIGSFETKDVLSVTEPKVFKITEIKEFNMKPTVDPQQIIADAKDSYERNALGKV